MRVVRHPSRPLRHLAAGLVLALLPGLAAAAYEVNLPPPASPIAARIFDLHMLIFWVCVAILLLVLGIMLYSVVAYRKSRGHKPATFHDNVKLEALWTVIPFLILVGMAIPSTATLIDMEDTSRADMTVRITGYQWRWHYAYPEQDLEFFSKLATPREQIENREAKGENYLLEVDNPLVLPVGKKIRLVMTANDVIHAWWVPELGVKKDTIPGFLNESWVKIDRPGVYRGQCAELCGKDHGFMPIVVNAVSQQEFDQWVAAQQKQTVARAAQAQQAAAKTYSRDELMARGKEVYQQCAACHGQNGEGIGPFPKLAGSAVATGPLEKHLDVVLHGVPGTAMQAFGQQLNDLDIAAVVTYERNSFGNKAGDVVQPAQVQSAR